MGYDVFISYSTQHNSADVEKISNFLESNGIECWYAPRDIPPGERYSRSIISALNGCPIFLLVYSDGSNNSDHVINEIERAFNAKRKIIPFRVESVRPSEDLEYFISTSQWIDAFPDDKYDVALKKLLDAIIKIRSSISPPAKTEILSSQVQQVDFPILSNAVDTKNEFSKDELRLKKRIKAATEDGIIEDTEKQKIEFSAKAFGISEERVQELIEIVQGEASTFNEDENIYIKTLKRVILNGQINEAERPKLTVLREDLEISEDRARELESLLVTDMPIVDIVAGVGSDGINASAAIPQSNQIEAVTTTANWPEVGRAFLKQLKETLEVSRLPYTPTFISADELIDEKLFLRYDITDKYFFAVEFQGKRNQNVTVIWGFYPRNVKRDPIFRKICNELSQSKDLLNSKGEIEINDYQYGFDNYNFRFVGDVRVDFGELQKDDFSKHVSEQLIALSNLIWPTIGRNITESSSINASEELDGSKNTAIDSQVTTWALLCKELNCKYEQYLEELEVTFNQDEELHISLSLPFIKSIYLGLDYDIEKSCAIFYSSGQKRYTSAWFAENMPEEFQNPIYWEDDTDPIYWEVKFQPEDLWTNMQALIEQEVFRTMDILLPKAVESMHLINKLPQLIDDFISQAIARVFPQAEGWEYYEDAKGFGTWSGISFFKNTWKNELQNEERGIFSLRLECHSRFDNLFIGVAKADEMLKLDQEKADELFNKTSEILGDGSSTKWWPYYKYLDDEYRYSANYRDKINEFIAYTVSQFNKLKELTPLIDEIITNKYYSIES